MRRVLIVLAACAAVVPTPGVRAKAPPPSKEQIAAFIAQLKDDDPLARQDAAEALGKMGPNAADAVPALREALHDKSVRGPAAAALAQIGKPAVPELVKGLKSTDWYISRCSATILARIGKPAVPALVAILRDEEAGPVRAQAAGVLGEIGPPAEDAIPALVEIFKDRQLTFDIDVPNLKNWCPALVIEDQASGRRSAAAWALGRIGLKALPALAEAAQDNPRIRPTAFLALVRFLQDELPEAFGELKKEEARLVVLGLLLETPHMIEAVKDHDPVTRGLAIRALGEVKPGKKVLPFLVAGLNDRNPSVRIEAAKALSSLGPDAKEAVPALMKALRDEGLAGRDLGSLPEDGFATDAVCTAATRALLQMGPEEKRRLIKDGVPFLIAGLGSDNVHARRFAAEALAELGPDAKAAAPALATLLTEEDVARAVGAGDALARIGEPAVPFVVRLLKNQNARVRTLGAQAAARMHCRDSTLVPALIDALKDEVKDGRRAAAKALGGMGPKARNAIPALQAALRDTDPQTSLAAAAALPRVGGATKEALAKVMALLKSENRAIHEHALMALRSFGPIDREAVPLLEELLKDDDAKCRIGAARILARTSPEKIENAVLALAELLGDKHTAENAAQALGEIGPAARDAVPALIGALQDLSRDHDFAERQSVIRALGSIGTDAVAAVPVLARELDEEFGSRSAAEALGRIGPGARTAIPALTVLLKDADEHDRAAAAAALGDIGPAARGTVPRLKPLLRDESPAVRAWAAYALLKLTGDEATYLPALLALLRDKSDEGWVGRHAALAALERLAPTIKAAVPGLTEGLADPDPDVRREAAWALGRIGPRAKPAVPGLIKLLQDSEPWVVVRTAAAQALGQIGPAGADAIPRLTELADGDDADIAAAAEEALVRIRATGQKP